jgi:hypothetical protein
MAAAALLLPFAAWMLVCRRLHATQHWLFALPLAAPLAVGSSSVVWWGLMQLRVESQRGLIAADAGIWLAVISVLLLRRAGATPTTAGAAAVAPGRTPWIVLTVGATAFGLGTIAFVADTAVMPHGDWDAWAIWNLRARFLYRGYPDYWRDGFSPMLAWSHVDYPLLIPLAVAREWTFLGRESTAVPAAFAALFAFSTVLGAAGSVGRARSSTYGWLTAVAILACPAFVEYSSSQGADVPLAFFILATFVWMFRAVESPSTRSAWLLAGASAGLAAWTKNEGALFLVVCVTVLAIRSSGVGDRAGLRGVGLRGVGLLLVGALPMIAALVALKALARDNDLLQAQSAQSLLTAFGSVDRVTTVVAGIGRALWSGGATGVGVLPIVAAFMFVVGVERPANPVPCMALVTLALLIAGYMCVFAMTPHDLAWQMTTSLDRVMLHAFPTLVWSGMMLARD